VDPCVTSTRKIVRDQNAFDICGFTSHMFRGVIGHPLDRISAIDLESEGIVTRFAFREFYYKAILGHLPLKMPEGWIAVRDSEWCLYLRKNIEERWITERLKALQLDEPRMVLACTICKWL
jgi:hypothetical protein